MKGKVLEEEGPDERSRVSHSDIPQGLINMNRPYVTVFFDPIKQKVGVNHNLKEGWNGAIELLEEGLKIAQSQTKKGKIIIPGSLVVPRPS